MKKNYALNKSISMAKIFLLCALTVNVAFGQVNKTTSKSEKSSLNHPAATVQDMNTHPAEDKTTTDVLGLKISAERPAGLVSIEAEINLILIDIRTLLATDSNATQFYKIQEQTFRKKTEQICPSIDVMNLISGSSPFRASQKTEKNELFIAFDFLSDVLNDLSVLSKGTKN